MSATDMFFYGFSVMGYLEWKTFFFFIDNRLSKSLITQNFNAATRRVLSLDTYQMDNVTCLLCCWTTNLLEWDWDSFRLYRFKVHESITWNTSITKLKCIHPTSALTVQVYKTITDLMALWLPWQHRMIISNMSHCLSAILSIHYTDS